MIETQKKKCDPNNLKFKTTIKTEMCVFGKEKTRKTRDYEFI